MNTKEAASADPRQRLLLNMRPTVSHPPVSELPELPISVDMTSDIPSGWDDRKRK